MLINQEITKCDSENCCSALQCLCCYVVLLFLLGKPNLSLWLTKHCWGGVNLFKMHKLFRQHINHIQVNDKTNTCPERNGEF